MNDGESQYCDYISIIFQVLMWKEFPPWRFIVIALSLCCNKFLYWSLNFDSMYWLRLNLIKHDIYNDSAIDEIRDKNRYDVNSVLLKFRVGHADVSTKLG